MPIAKPMPIAQPRAVPKQPTARARPLPRTAGVLLAAGASGAVLTIGEVASPVTGPLTLLFLLMAPGIAVAALLRSVAPGTRVLIALLAGAVLDLLVVEVMLALRVWSVRGGVVAVTALTVGLLLPSAATAPRRSRTRHPRETPRSAAGAARASVPTVDGGRPVAAPGREG